MSKLSMNMEPGYMALSIYYQWISSRCGCVLDSQPRQGKHMTVQNYYDQFLCWKNKLESVNYIYNEEWYVDDFISGLKIDLMVRVSRHKWIRRLSDAFRRAEIEEIFLSWEENPVLDDADEVFDDMSHPQNVHSDKLQGAGVIGDDKSDEKLVQIEADPKKSVSSNADHKVFDELSQPNFTATTAYTMIAEELDVDYGLNSQTGTTSNRVLGNSETETFKMLNKSTEQNAEIESQLLCWLKKLDCDFIDSKGGKQDIDKMPTTSIVELWVGMVLFLSNVDVWNGNVLFSFDPGGSFFVLRAGDFEICEEQQRALADFHVGALTQICITFEISGRALFTIAYIEHLFYSLSGSITFGHHNVFLHKVAQHILLSNMPRFKPSQAWASRYSNNEPLLVGLNCDGLLCSMLAFGTDYDYIESVGIKRNLDRMHSRSIVELCIDRVFIFIFDPGGIFEFYNDCWLDKLNAKLVDEWPLLKTVSTLATLFYSLCLTWEENGSHQSINSWIGEISSWYENIIEFGGPLGKLQLLCKLPAWGVFQSVLIAEFSVHPSLTSTPGLPSSRNPLTTHVIGAIYDKTGDIGLISKLLCYMCVNGKCFANARRHELQVQRQVFSTPFIFTTANLVVQGRMHWVLMLHNSEEEDFLSRTIASLLVPLLRSCNGHVKETTSYAYTISSYASAYDTLVLMAMQTRVFSIFVWDPGLGATIAYILVDRAGFEMHNRAKNKQEAARSAPAWLALHNIYATNASEVYILGVKDVFKREGKRMVCIEVMIRIQKDWRKCWMGICKEEEDMHWSNVI